MYGPGGSEFVALPAQPGEPDLEPDELGPLRVARLHGIRVDQSRRIVERRADDLLVQFVEPCLSGISFLVIDHYDEAQLVGLIPLLFGSLVLNPRPAPTGL
jgi:hypothetical protein